MTQAELVKYVQSLQAAKVTGRKPASLLAKGMIMLNVDTHALTTVPSLEAARTLVRSQGKHIFTGRVYNPTLAVSAGNPSQAIHIYRGNMVFISATLGHTAEQLDITVSTILANLNKAIHVELREPRKPITTLLNKKYQPIRVTDLAPMPGTEARVVHYPAVGRI